MAGNSPELKNYYSLDERGIVRVEKETKKSLDDLKSEILSQEKQKKAVIDQITQKINIKELFKDLKEENLANGAAFVAFLQSKNANISWTEKNAQGKYEQKELGEYVALIQLYLSLKGLYGGKIDGSIDRGGDGGSALWSALRTEFPVGHAENTPGGNLSFDLSTTRFDTKNGKTHIIGKDETGTVRSYLVGDTLSQSKEIQGLKSAEILKNENVRVSLENINLVIDGLISVGKMTPEEKAEFEKDVITYLNTFGDKVPTEAQFFEKFGVNFNSNIKQKREVLRIDYIILNSRDASKRQQLQYEIMDKLRDLGGFQFVSDYIADKKTLETTKLTQEELEKIYTSFQAGNVPTGYKWINNDMLEEFKDKTQKADKLRNSAKNQTQELLKKQLKEQFPNATEDEFNKLVTETSKKQEDAYRELTGKKTLQHILMEGYMMENMTKSSIKTLGRKMYVQQSDKLLNMYADIEGVGAWNPSTRARNITAEVAKMVAIEAAILAVGTLTAHTATAGLHALVRGARGAKTAVFLNNFKRGAEVMNLANRGTRVGRNVYKATELGVQGAAFYEGSNVAKNIFHDKPRLEGRDSLSEIAKTTAMLGVGRLVDKLRKSQKLTVFPGVFGKGKLQVKNPLFEMPGAKEGLIKRFAKEGGRLLFGGSALFTLEGIGELLIDGDSTFTSEELIQSVMMYALLKHSGAIGNRVMRLFKKNGKPVLDTQTDQAARRGQATTDSKGGADKFKAPEKSLSTKEIESKISDSQGYLKGNNERLERLNKKLKSETDPEKLNKLKKDIKLTEKAIANNQKDITDFQKQLDASKISSTGEKPQLPEGAPKVDSYPTNAPKDIQTPQTTGTSNARPVRPGGVDGASTPGG